MARERDILLDTGPLVALLDAADARHRDCVAQWNELGPRCLTTEAVLTEATHLVARGGADANIPLDFVLASGIPIVGLERAGHEHAARLMRRFRNVPMDYADATLVVTADALKVRRVFTLDRRGFSTYRRHDGARFTLAP